MEPKVEPTWAFALHDMLRRSSVAVEVEKLTRSYHSTLRNGLIVSVLLLGFFVFGQQEETVEESDKTETTEESDTTEATENSDEDSSEAETTEDSETNHEEQHTPSRTLDGIEEDSIVESNDTVEENSNVQENSRTEDPTEDEESDSEIFTPTEKLSEDVPIAFPVDI